MSIQPLSRRGFVVGVGASFAAYGFSKTRFGVVLGAETEELTGLTLAEASVRIHSGKVTATQLTRTCLERIKSYKPKLDCFITMMRDKALAQAAVLDAEQKAGKLRGPLHGIRNVCLRLRKDINELSSAISFSTSLQAEWNSTFI